MTRKISPFTFTVRYEAECFKCFKKIKPGEEAGYVGKWMACKGCLAQAVYSQSAE